MGAVAAATGFAGCWLEGQGCACSPGDTYPAACVVAPAHPIQRPKRRTLRQRGSGCRRAWQRQQQQQSGGSGSTHCPAT
jgi:hypothetical protein